MMTRGDSLLQRQRCSDRDGDQADRYDEGSNPNQADAMRKRLRIESQRAAKID